MAVAAIRRSRSPFTMLVANLSYRRNYRGDRQRLSELDLCRGPAWNGLPLSDHEEAFQNISTITLPSQSEGLRLDVSGA